MTNNRWYYLLFAAKFRLEISPYVIICNPFLTLNSCISSCMVCWLYKIITNLICL